MTFNSLSILLINNIPDITDILYIERIVYSSTTYRGYRGDIGTIMPYDFFYIRKFIKICVEMLYNSCNLLKIKLLHRYNTKQCIIS